MHRVQIYLTISALIRRILDEHLGSASGSTQQDPFAAVIGIGNGDGAPVAEHYEDFLYGSRC